MESISERFYAAVSPIVPTSLSEAETEVYPYAVYEHEPEYRYSKGGLYKVTSTVTCDIYGKDYDDIISLAEEVRTAVEVQLNAGGFTARLASSRKECYEGKWDITLTFNIIQHV